MKKYLIYTALECVSLGVIFYGYLSFIIFALLFHELAEKNRPAREAEVEENTGEE